MSLHKLFLPSWYPQVSGLHLSLSLPPGLNVSASALPVALIFHVWIT